MRLLSSRLTLFYKFILLPMVSIGAIFFLLWAIKTIPGRMPFVAFIWIAACIIWAIYLSWPIKKVSLAGDNLYISNFFKEIAVPVSEIADVRERYLTKPRRIVIYFRDPTEFGDKVVFYAPVRPRFYFSQHPLVGELLDLARSHTETGFLTRPVR
jgi:hypothetical protein